MHSPTIHLTYLISTGKVILVFVIFVFFAEHNQEQLVLLNKFIMKILIIGISGFIGRELARTLVARGHRVTGLSRNPQRAQNIFDAGIEMKRWDGTSLSTLADALDGIDGIVNLAGENIAAGPGQKSVKPG